MSRFAMLFATLAMLSLFAAGMYVQVTYIRERLGNCQELLDELSVLNSELKGLSRRGIFSRGLAIPANDVWSYINGWSGLRTMYTCAGMFVSALDYIEKAGNPSPTRARCVRELRSSASLLRLLILGTLAASLMRGTVRMELSDGTLATRRYLALRAEFAYLLTDYRPDLLPSLRNSLEKELAGHSSHCQ